MVLSSRVSRDDRTIPVSCNYIDTLSEDERTEIRKVLEEGLSEEERETMESVNELADVADYGRVDMAEGTIITKPCFSDTIVTVTTRAFVSEVITRASK